MSEFFCRGCRNFIEEEHMRYENMHDICPICGCTDTKYCGREELAEYGEEDYEHDDSFVEDSEEY